MPREFAAEDFADDCFECELLIGVFVEEAHEFFEFCVNVGGVCVEFVPWNQATCGVLRSDCHVCT